MTGMTCSHCVSSVTEEISAIAGGVSEVSVDLHAGGGFHGDGVERGPPGGRGAGAGGGRGGRVQPRPPAS